MEKPHSERCLVRFNYFLSLRGIEFERYEPMKKSAFIISLLRAALVVLAYKEVTHPKAAIIPPGTGRTTVHYIKSCYQISRAYLKDFFQRRLPSS